MMIMLWFIGAFTDLLDTFYKIRERNSPVLVLVHFFHSHLYQVLIMNENNNIQ